MLQTDYGSATSRAGMQIIAPNNSASIYRSTATTPTTTVIGTSKRQGLSLQNEPTPNSPSTSLTTNMTAAALAAPKPADVQPYGSLSSLGQTLPSGFNFLQGEKVELDSTSLNPAVVAARKSLMVPQQQHPGHGMGQHGVGQHMSQFQQSQQQQQQLSEYQLNPIEAFRFLAIIDEGREKLQLIGRLIAENSRRRDAASSSDQQRRDIVNLMRNQKQLEAQFEELMKLREEYRHSTNKNAAAQNERAIEAVFHQLQHSSNSIALYLRDQPSAQGGNAQKLLRDHEDLTNELNLVASELRNLTFARLVESIHKRDSKRTALDDMRKQQETRAITIAQLQDDLRSVIDRHRRESEKSTQSIALKSAAIKSTRKINYARKLYEEATADAEQEAAERIHRSRLSKLQAEILDLVNEIEENRIVNDKLSSFWSKQQDGLSTVKKDWDEKLDKDTMQQQGLHDRLLQVRNAQRSELDALSVRWDKEVEEKRQRLEQLKRRIIENECKRELTEKMNHAQRVIRFHWRVYRRRKEAAKKRKKKRVSAKSASQTNGGLALNRSNR